MEWWYIEVWCYVCLISSDPSVVLVVDDLLWIRWGIFGLDVSWCPLIRTVISEPDGLAGQVDVAFLLDSFNFFILSACQRRWVFCWSFNGTGVMIMLKLVLIRLFRNSSAGDGKVSLTRVWRYVVRALVISVSPVFFFRIFSVVPTTLRLWYGLDVIFTILSWLQKLRNLLVLKQETLCKLIFSASPNFLKMLFSTFVTASLVLLSRMS